MWCILASVWLNCNCFDGRRLRIIKFNQYFIFGANQLFYCLYKFSFCFYFLTRQLLRGLHLFFVEASQSKNLKKDLFYRIFLSFFQILHLLDLEEYSSKKFSKFQVCKNIRIFFNVSKSSSPSNINSSLQFTILLWLSFPKLLLFKGL